jgi:hypothetical protein
MYSPELYQLDRLRTSLPESAAIACDWIEDKCQELASEPNASRFYIALSQCTTRFGHEAVFGSQAQTASIAEEYLKKNSISASEYARMWLICTLLTENRAFYGERTRKLIEVADYKELITFLRYLITLPDPEEFHFAAVEALRTNITPVFDAISANNPYPARYFNEQQWNQMYLKAAFMGRDLNEIEGVEERANANLARIISDYAHERWAAGRQIDPVIWKPVYPFLNDVLHEDMKRLLSSKDPAENEAAALVCHASASPLSQELLGQYPELETSAARGLLNWNQLGTATTTP